MSYTNSIIPRALILIAALGFSLPVFSQSKEIWKTGKVTTYGGVVKTSSVEGSISELPGSSPIFAVCITNNNINKPELFITSLPFKCGDNYKISIRFDKEKLVYYPSNLPPRIADDGNILYPMILDPYKSSDFYPDEKSGEIKPVFQEFIKKARSCSRMYLMMESQGKKYIMTFSLKGSGRALSYVLGQ